MFNFVHFVYLWSEQLVLEDSKNIFRPWAYWLLYIYIYFSHIKAWITV